MTWNRIQFTPDLLPSDVTGVSVFNQMTNDFEFRPGAIFANIVIADEINRASPKTQSALLEVMEEHTVTTDAVVYPVPRPFMVIATQNPIDMEGTYQLPEAQLDRFLMEISVGYPESDAEVMVLRTQRDFPTLDDLSPVMTITQLEEMIGHVKTIEVSPAIEEYVVALSAFTRSAPEIRLGVSPRGSLALLRGGPCPGRHGRPALRHPRRREGGRALRAGAPDDLATGSGDAGADEVRDGRARAAERSGPPFGDELTGRRGIGAAS